VTADDEPLPLKLGFSGLSGGAKRSAALDLVDVKLVDVRRIREAAEEMRVPEPRSVVSYLYFLERAGTSNNDIKRRRRQREIRPHRETLEIVVLNRIRLAARPALC
jgi:hypothetical protein